MSRPSNIVPFRPRRRRGAPVANDPLACEALYLLEYLQARLATEPGIRKRTRAQLVDMAEEGTGLLRHALLCRGVRP